MTNEIQASEDSNHGNKTKDFFSDHESEGDEGEGVLNGETVGVDDLDTECIGSEWTTWTQRALGVTQDLTHLYLLLVLENGLLPSDQTPWTLSHMNHTIHNEKRYK